MAKSNELKSQTAPIAILQAHTSAKMSKKITAKVFGEPGYMKPGDPDRWLIDCICQVTGAERETEKGTYGPYWLWKGHFRATDLKTGQRVESPTAIFPEIASALIEAARDGGINDGRGLAQNIMIAFRLGTTSESARVGKEGYAWTLKIIQPATQESSLDAYERQAYGMVQTQIDYDPETGEVSQEAAA
jgi:hypothetical protein